MKIHFLRKTHSELAGEMGWLAPGCCSLEAGIGCRPCSAVAQADSELGGFSVELFRKCHWNDFHAASCPSPAAAFLPTRK